MGLLEGRPAGVINKSKIEERIKAKNSGKYDIADKIRDELLNAGILIEDEKGKTKWRYK